MLANQEELATSPTTPKRKRTHEDRVQAVKSAFKVSVWVRERGRERDNRIPGQQNDSYLSQSSKQTTRNRNTGSVYTPSKAGGGHGPPDGAALRAKGVGSQ